MTQGELAKALGLTAHSNISDYERGHRLPPQDIIVAAEKALNAPTDILQTAYELARREFAQRAVEQLLETRRSSLDST